MNDIYKQLEESKLYVKGLKMSLVSRTDPAQVSLIAKIPFKALQIREALLYRVTDLTDASCELVDAMNLVSAACVTRAFQESLAALFYINRKVKKAITDKDVTILDDTLMKSLLGAKNNPDMCDPINVLTLIDKVEREIPGFKIVYDNLSELTHPNWAGTLGLFSRINQEELWVDFGRNISLKDSTQVQIINTLQAGLVLVVDIYDEFADFLPELIAVCENNIKQKMT